MTRFDRREFSLRALTTIDSRQTIIVDYRRALSIGRASLSGMFKSALPREACIRHVALGIPHPVSLSRAMELPILYPEPFSFLTDLRTLRVCSVKFLLRTTTKAEYPGRK